MRDVAASLRVAVARRRRSMPSRQTSSTGHHPPPLAAAANPIVGGRGRVGGVGCGVM